MMHCMVIHIRNEFLTTKKENMEYHKKIITNLPCPYCKEHASWYDKKD